MITRFFDMLQEMYSRASSGIFSLVKSCYPESFRFLCLWAPPLLNQEKAEVTLVTLMSSILPHHPHLGDERWSLWGSRQQHLLPALVVRLNHSGGGPASTWMAGPQHHHHLFPLFSPSSPSPSSPRLSISPSSCSPPSPS